MASSGSEDELRVKRKEKKSKESKKRSRKESSTEEGVEEKTPVKKERKEKKQKEDKKRSRKDSASSDEGVVDRNPVKKAGTLANVVKNADGEEMIEIGNMRYVTVRSFKGKTFVDIREFYRDKATGEMKPGKKGISLGAGQFATLKSLIPEIEAKIR